MKVALLKKHAPLVVPIVILALVFGGAYAAERVLPVGDAQLARYADEVIEICSKDTYPPRCYDVELPKLMDRGVSMEDIFKVTALIQDRVNNYFYCHVLGHNVSAKETAKDPEKWTEVVARCPTGMCSNGCLHGAAQERFRDDALSKEEIQALIPEFRTICEPEGHRNFSGIEKSSCNHSMGHLAMYVSGADIVTATDVCDQIAKKGAADYTQTCYEGAYMQIFQPLEPEDFTLVEHIPAKTIPEAEAFCDQFEGERRAACHRESWPLYRESLDEAEGLTHFCSLVPDQESQRRCYNAMFYVLTAQFNFELDRIIPLCDQLPEKRMAQCFANAASRHIETDHRLIPQAIKLCEAAASRGADARCYDELLFYSTFSFHQGSDTFNQLCEALPEPWSGKCFRGEGKEAHPSRNDYGI